MPACAVGLPGGLPWLPMDEQFDETKMFGFLGNELQAGLAQVCAFLKSYRSAPPSCGCLHALGWCSQQQQAGGIVRDARSVRAML